ncbi:MAG: DUF7710 domain-containing protein [Pseudomonadota bacterium]
MTETVWIFNAAGATFPGGVFGSLEQAESWISKHGLSGTLTEYPLDAGAYDWAVSLGYFQPKKPEHESAKFVGAFTSSRQTHFHYEAGSRTGAS